MKDTGEDTSHIYIPTLHYDLHTHLSGEVAASFELLEEERHGDGGEEQDDGPEENIGDVGAVMTTCTALELAPELHTALKNRTTASIHKTLL